MDLILSVPDVFFYLECVFKHPELKHFLVVGQQEGEMPLVITPTESCVPALGVVYLATKVQATPLSA